MVLLFFIIIAEIIVIIVIYTVYMCVYTVYVTAPCDFVLDISGLIESVLFLFTLLFDFIDYILK